MIQIQSEPKTKNLLREAAFSELERSMYLALETYSNVHRGAGFKSLATTAIFEEARRIVLDHAALEHGQFEVVFCHPGMSHEIQRHLTPSRTRLFSSAELGLPLGVRAIVADRKELSAITPPLVGGGTVDLVLPRSVVWSKVPDLLEAGTPAVVNIVAFAKALLIAERMGKRVFLDGNTAPRPAEEILGLEDIGSCVGTELLERIRSSFIGRHFRGHINFDSAASTSAPLAVWNAVRVALRQPPGTQGEAAAVVKRDLAAFLGAPSEEFEVIFTANTTGAINLAARLLARGQLKRGDAIVLNSWVEHNSNELPWRTIPGVALKKIPLAENGLVDIGALATLMRRYAGKVGLVAVSGASNVTGEPVDIQKVCEIAHRHGALTLMDGAQVFAHRSVDLSKLGVDFFSFSGHKAYAPFGTGALVARRKCLPQGPSILDAMRRAGEENAVGIAALGKAVRLLDRIGMETIQSEEHRLSQRMVRGLAHVNGLKIHGVKGILAFHVHGIPHNLASRMLAESAGIGTRSGCFCAHLFVQRLLKIHPFRAQLAALLMRMLPALAKSLLPGLVRVSIGAENDEDDIDTLIESLTRISRYRPAFPDRALSRYHSGTPNVPRTAATSRTETDIAERIRKVYAIVPEHGPAGRSMGSFDPHRFSSELARGIGFAAVIVGLGLALGGLAKLKRVENIDHLVTTGLFSRLRHPMYTGFIVWILGWIAFHGSLTSIPIALFAIGNILYWRLLEERALESRYGEDFRRYRERTWF